MLQMQISVPETEIEELDKKDTEVTQRVLWRKQQVAAETLVR